MDTGKFTTKTAQSVAILHNSLYSLYDGDRTGKDSVLKNVHSSVENAKRVVKGMEFGIEVTEIKENSKARLVHDQI